MSFFKKKPKGGKHFIIVFDIGSGSIGGSFVSLDSARIPEIIFTTRRDIPFQEKLDFQRFLDLMITTLEEMFVAMQRSGGGVKIDGAFCVLASPWYASQTRLVHYTQPTAFAVTEKGLQQLIQKEIALFRSSKLFAGSTVGDMTPEIMESKNIQMKLNGFEVKKPFGKRVNELEIALYISMIPPNIFKSINGTIVKFWHSPSVHFSSFSFTAFDMIRDVFTEESSFLFMDISAEVTDISLAKDNVLLESISFPSGKNTLIRALVEGMKTNSTVAISEFDMYVNGKSTPEHAAQIESILQDATKEWLSYFEGALSQFATEFPIPRTLFFTADDNVSKWYESAIGHTDFTKLVQEEGSFNVRILGNDFLSKFVQVLEPDFADPFLAIETMFANKFISLENQ